MNIRSNKKIFCLVSVLCAGLLSVNIARSYDGDVDYSAPYVTLDPETGKLITVDPKQQPATAQQQHSSTDPNAALSTSADTTAAADSTATASDTTAGQSNGSSGNSVIIAIAAIVAVAVVVAIARRKPGNTSDNHTA